MDSHISNKIGIVRKPHCCRVCDETIAKGDECHIYTGVGDNGFYTIYFHHDCWDYSRHFDEWDWESISPGELTLQEVKLALIDQAREVRK